MFTDDPSPYRPRPETGQPWVTVLIVMVGAAALFFSAELLDRFRQPKAQALLRAKATRSMPVPLPPAPPLVTVAPQAEAVAPQTLRPERPVVVAAAPPPARITIYLCKGYDGGTFWSDTVCSTQRALIDRMTTVPGSLTFDQQVAIARGEANEAAALYRDQSQGAAVAIRNDRASSASAACPALNEQLRQLDAWARNPRSGQEQDRIRRERMEILGRRAMLGC